MRVIAGQWRARRLLGPPRGAETRPTSDRVREAVFNVVSERVEGARVLDLFAGTGALGIEALSRGAAHVTFVEADRGLCETIQTNLENLEAPAELFTLLKRDVRRSLKGLTGPFDLVFIDPPYGHLLEREALAALCAADALAPGATVVVEHASREEVALPPAAAAVLGSPDTRAYGDTSVTLFTARPTAPAAPSLVEAAPGPRRAGPPGPPRGRPPPRPRRPGRPPRGGRRPRAGGARGVWRSTRAPSTRPPAATSTSSTARPRSSTPPWWPSRRTSGSSTSSTWASASRSCARSSATTRASRST